MKFNVYCTEERYGILDISAHCEDAASKRVYDMYREHGIPFVSSHFKVDSIFPSELVEENED